MTVPTMRGRIWHTRGAIVNGASGVNEAIVLGLLPQRLRDHSKAREFASAAVRLCDSFASMGFPWAGDATPAAVRSELEKLEWQAKQMQSKLEALVPGDAGVCAFDVLDGRYRVASLSSPPGAPRGLGALCERLHTDLAALRDACQSAHDAIQPAKSAPKDSERRFVGVLVAAYQEAFGEAPPQRGWFAENLVPKLAGPLRMSIGWRIVGEVVQAAS